MVLLVCIGVQGRLGALMVWVCGNISIVGGVNLSYIRYDVGCGTRVQFWHDLWGKANFKD